MVQRADPRIEIIFSFLFAVEMAISHRWPVVFFGLFTGAALAFYFKVSFMKLLKRLLLADLFLLLVILTLPFTTPGKTWFELGPLSLSREGLALALLIFAKSNAVLLTTYVLLGERSVFELAHALHHLRVPSKLVQLLFFTCRYLSLLEREFRRLLEAAKLRGFTPQTALRSYRTFAYLMASLFLRSYDRSLRVYEAMVLRGYRGYFPVWHHFLWRRRDTFWALGAGAYLLLLASLPHIL